jgi:hypothetical protein
VSVRRPSNENVGFSIAGMEYGFTVHTYARVTLTPTAPSAANTGSILSTIGSDTFPAGIGNPKLMLHRDGGVCMFHTERK